MSLDSLETSIQKLLSELYPPFEATAPTLLNQLFQLIDSRYKGDALRCLLDFLVPAKHILDTVQQAACGLYSDVIFLCEGWPLCLGDQVVIHLAPISPLFLQPGDFYLKVAPFCDQSARIVICSLLGEEGLEVEVVEETPIPETHYPCLFSSDWLEDINQGRHGAPLSQCLVATEQGIVRLSWEKVAVPEFVVVQESVGGSMASVSPSFSPPQPSLTSSLPNFSKDSSNVLSPHSPPNESASDQSNVTVQNSTSSTSAHSPAFTVKTRISPAKHGIAVSLCLVDTSLTPSSQLVKLKDADAEPKPIGWVSPNTWDSRVTGLEPVTTTGANQPVWEDFTKRVDKSLDNENTVTVKDTITKQSVSESPTAAEGEYIDIMQATMMFSKAQGQREEQQRSGVQMPMEAQMQIYPQRHAQIQPRVQLESFRPSQRPTNTLLMHPEHSPAHMLFHPSPQPYHHHHQGPTPTMFTETGSISAPHHSQSHHPQLDSELSQCLRTVRFSEKPCTPCMKRRQVDTVVQPQELRCRYRDSYQAAIKNPVAVGQETRRGNMSTVLEEDGDSYSHVERPKPLGTDTEDPWCSVQSMPTLVGDICKESGEKNTAHWRARDPRGTTFPEYMDANPVKQSDLPEQLTIKHCAALRDTAKTNSNKHGNEKYSETGKEINPLDWSGSNSPQQSHVCCSKPPSETSGTPQERLRTVPNCLRASPHFSRTSKASQNRPESVSDGRCSSLSTTVVDTSQQCEVVIVEGRNVRRKENKNCSAEVPQLHVVKCKNSTAFGLVSPKMSRRRMAAQDTSPTTRTCQQIENQSQAAPPSAAETQRSFHPTSTCPRPDHLPIGPPDPRAHPVFLGIASVTGGRDRTGRPIVELYGDHPGWRSAVTSQEVCQMLVYFHLITRREVREAGMTLIFDGRKTNPQPQLYKALLTLQEQSPQVLNSVVLLVSKDTCRGAERCPGIQTITVSSMKALLKLVEASHLSSYLDGSLCHSHLDWLELHQKLFPFVSDLHEASSLLQSAIRKLEEPKKTDSVQNVQQCMMDQKTLMKEVLEESKLVSLQREGGSILARLRRESDLKYPHCDNLSDAVDSVTSLYNHMEEQVHILVHNSNVSLEYLEYLKQLRGMEDHFTQMQQWYNVEGERHLLEAESVHDSGERLEQILNSFTGFLIEANDRRHHAMSLVSEAEHLQRSGSSYSETETFKSLVQAFRSDLENFLCRAEACGRELQTMVTVCDFCEQAVTLANECIDHMEHRPTDPQLTQCHSHEIADSSLCPSDCSKAQGATQVPDNDKDKLQDFQDKFLQFSLEKFQEMKVQASSLQGSRGMRVWNVAWLRCQEAQQQLQERIQEAQRNHSCECHYIDVVSTTSAATSPSGQNLVVQSIPGTQHPQWEGFVSGVVDLGKRKPMMGSNGTNSTNIACCNIIIKPEENSDTGASRGSKSSPQSPNKSTRGREREVRRRQSSRARRDRDAAALSQSHTVGCQWFPWARGLKARSISQDSCTTAAATAGSSTPPEQSVRSPSSCSHHGQPSCRILKEAQKYQISRHGSFCSEESYLSEKGAAGGERTSCCKHSSLPGGRYDETFFLGNTQEISSTALRLQRVLEELVVTEREYVRSLSYILTHYFPLLDRQDIPQDLRGKRGIIFGNLEKLHNFHSHYFLPELEECQREPAMVARCFLRHNESFGLYALYSKNKPQSDALILHRRHDIFKRKQQELGDMMDLSSYLLRPIQRISKYSLLLQDMLALAGSYRPKDMIQDRLLRPSVSTQNVCGPGAYVPDLTSGERERERAEIQSAADLVRFQMRHGNDLLTMDAIRDCDVNLKEQGQLIRQDEFTVFFRKKKCIRRVFLFEDLILFSKTKKTDVGNDVYVYKQSFKTSDIGMTHNSVVGSLCFEIWFRRRKSEDTYTLKATSMEGKKAWTTDLERILWDQASHSRELRMQERVFMGMGRKPFMDIQPSDAAICDRAVTGVLPGRIPVACCSHRSLDFPRPHSIGSGSTASTTLSQSSSSSGRGSLPPAGYPGNLSHGVEPGPALCSSRDALMDNELNSHHLHHHLHDNCEQWKRLHPLIDANTSSSECINHSCLSTMAVETLDENSSSSAPQFPKSSPPLCRTPSLRRHDSPVITRKKLGVAPQPPHLVKAQQSDEMVMSKSTEV